MPAIIGVCRGGGPQAACREKESERGTFFPEEPRGVVTCPGLPGSQPPSRVLSGFPGFVPPPAAVDGPSPGQMVPPGLWLTSNYYLVTRHWTQRPVFLTAPRSLSYALASHSPGSHAPRTESIYQERGLEPSALCVSFNPSWRPCKGVLVSLPLCHRQGH